MDIDLLKRIEDWCQDVLATSVAAKKRHRRCKHRTSEEIRFLTPPGSIEMDVPIDTDETPRQKRRRGNSISRRSQRSSALSSGYGSESGIEKASAGGARADLASKGRTVPVRWINRSLLEHPLYEPPEYVGRIVRQFSESNLNSTFIPMQLKERLRRKAKFEEFGDHVFDNASTDPTNAERLFTEVELVIALAENAFRSSDDESSWYLAVQRVLSFDGMGNNTPQVVCTTAYVD
ncbi:uncharacterized protein DFL_008213 [Arthrobotrys flagrans]|uniref:Uncharacterized protein n=1 Tax=Arthrobotrys flagrans TaxID=97331 RepID=A0A436ZN44_ARTFL|nr:hypothetical protein DFL_008213 [Arthrobotrys flagrans]